MEKLNIAELLRDCPTGMELDCTVFEDVTFEEIRTCCSYPIKLITNGRAEFLTEYGCISYGDTAKCVIFPKGKTTWEGFQRPFKDGDVVFYDDNIAIFKEWGDETLFRTYVKQYIHRESIDIGFPLFGKYIRKHTRFATEEKKQKLFDAIKANGYKWNPETKTLEKLIEPKFKVGDWIEFKYYERKPEKVIRIENNVYWLSSGATVMFQDESAWDLTTKKFDITILKPFDKVLVRDNNKQKWTVDMFSFYDKTLIYPFNCVGHYVNQCIPYESNEYLLGTTYDCEGYFKTWE